MERTVTIKLKRSELCSLILACTFCFIATQGENQSGEKWNDLHTKLTDILNEYDKKHD